MSLFLAAIGATAAALLEVLPNLGIGEAHPHPVLVFGIIWVVAAGLDRAIAWAFVGGIVLDALTNRPFGMSTFTLLLVFGVAQVIARTLIRVRPLVPIIAVAILSGAYSLLELVLYGAIRAPIIVANPVDAVMPGVVYDIVVAVLFGPLIVAVRDRFREQERLDW
jgi:rod shape-determining protein MreD